MKTEITIGLPELGGAGVSPRVEMMASIKKFVCVSTLSPQNRNVKMCVMMKMTVLVMIMRVMRKKMVMRMILMF